MISNMSNFFLLYIYIDKLDRYINLFLTVIGVLILFICLLSFFFPTTKSLGERTQKFNGFGVSMEISILTAFFLMGFILSLSSFFLQWKGFLDQKDIYEKQVTEKETKINERENIINNLKEQIEHSRTTNIVLGLEPRLSPAKGNISLKPSDLSCEYQIGRSEPQYAPVSIGTGSDNVFKVTIENIPRDAYIHHIKLSHKVANREWIIENFIPSEPRCELNEVISRE